MLRKMARLGWVLLFASLVLGAASAAWANSPGPWVACGSKSLGDACEFYGPGICVESADKSGCADQGEPADTCLICGHNPWTPCEGKQAGDWCGPTTAKCAAKSGEWCPDGQGECLYCGAALLEEGCEGKQSGDNCGSFGACGPYGNDGQLQCRWSSERSCEGKQTGETCGEELSGAYWRTDLDGDSRHCAAQDGPLECVVEQSGCSLVHVTSTTGMTLLVLLVGAALWRRRHPSC